MECVVLKLSSKFFPFYIFHIEGRVWTESFLKRTQVNYLTADRYRVDQHISALREVRRNVIEREKREQAREDREQLEHDMRKNEYDFMKDREIREAEAHAFIQNREKREQEEHDAKLVLLKAKTDFYLLQVKKMQRDLVE